MEKRLSDRMADDVLTMIVIDKRSVSGGKLPNRLDLSKELNTVLNENITFSGGYNEKK